MQLFLQILVSFSCFFFSLGVYRRNASGFRTHERGDKALKRSLSSAWSTPGAALPDLRVFVLGSKTQNSQLTVFPLDCFICKSWTGGAIEREN